MARKHKSRRQKRRVKPLWAELKSAAKTVAGEGKTLLKAGVQGARESIRDYKAEQKKAAQSRGCPQGTYLARDNRCYPVGSLAKDVVRAIPSGPTKEPRFVISVPGEVTAPSSEAFGAALKNAGGGIATQANRVNPSRMSIEGITITAKQMAKAKRQMAMVGGQYGAGGAPLVGIQQQPGLRQSISAGYVELENERKKREGLPAQHRAKRKGMLDKAVKSVTG